MSGVFLIMEDAANVADDSTIVAEFATLELGRQELLRVAFSLTTHDADVDVEIINADEIVVMKKSTAETLRLWLQKLSS